jgi:hypothetical protein
MTPLDRAQRLAASVWDLLADLCADLDFDAEGWRRRAREFLYDPQVTASDAELVAKARDIAHALLEWLSQYSTPESFKRLKDASKEYELSRFPTK